MIGNILTILAALIGVVFSAGIMLGKFYLVLISIASVVILSFIPCEDE